MYRIGFGIGITLAMGSPFSSTTTVGSCSFATLSKTCLIALASDSLIDRIARFLLLVLAPRCSRALMIDLYHDSPRRSNLWKLNLLWPRPSPEPRTLNLEL